LEGDVSKVELELPDGWEQTDHDMPVSKDLVSPDTGYLVVRIPMRRTAPDMVAVMLPRDVVERRASGEFLHADEPAVNGAAREALARTAVVIAGPAGCAEVSVEDARHLLSEEHCLLHELRGVGCPANGRLGLALRKAAGGS
jgi:hypothetical protein